MGADKVLRACMQALVLLNLVFVQMTEAAGLHWLAPLYALTLGAPLLDRFRGRRLYTWVWNGVVVGFFGLLVHHAQSAQLANVLEDGLVLAVLCQVHLLNNLGPEQKPDLLFFNSFLVALMAGYLTPGVGFPIAFLAFVPAFVVGLQLRCASEGGRALSSAVLRRLTSDGLKRAGVLLAASLLVFLFWPRDFGRKAFFHGRLELVTGSSKSAEVGFDEELRLDGKRRVGGEDRPALRVTLLEGAAEDVPTLWRGATAGAARGASWFPLDAQARRQAAPADEPWRRAGLRWLRGEEPAEGALRLEVTRLDRGTERLFAPLGARALTLSEEHVEEPLRGWHDGALESARKGPLRYELRVASEGERALGGAVRAELPAELAPYAASAPDPALAPTRARAQRLAERLPEGAEQHELVALVAAHLERTCAYLPPGAEGAASTLDEFLQGDAGGHCEFFASALATMLRSLGVPCRVVTGYRSSRWDGTARVLSFGTADAHAWVEVHDPRAGWYPVDPSPERLGRESGPGLWLRLRAAWDAVTAFDADGRAAVFAWARSAPGRLLELCRNHRLAAALALLALVAAPFGLLLRRRARTLPELRAYRRALRRARVELRPGETPRELLARARAADLRPDALAALEAATRAHEAARYAA